MNKIIEGWSNLAFDALGMLSDEKKAVAEQRKAICEGCPLKDGDFCSSEIEGVSVKTKESVTGCGCYLPAKILSFESECPRELW